MRSRSKTVPLPLGLLFTAIVAAAAAVATGGVATVATAAPLRTESPGTGVYRGFALQGAVTVGEEHGDFDGGEDLRETIAVTELRYTPATSWSFALTVPRVERSARVAGLGTATLSGLGDLAVTGKYRFFRQLGRWGDRQAAVEVGVKLPTGESRAPVGLGTPLGWPLALRRTLQPGTGSTDVFMELSYQQAHGRFVQAAAAGYRANGENAGYRFGDQAHLRFDAEAIVLPLTYETPGHEVFVLLEGSLEHRAADTYRGSALAGTRRTELLLAPGLEYVATEQLALGLSVAFPVVSRIDREGRKSRFNALLEARFAF
jgi:hypothetical protein